MILCKYDFFLCLRRRLSSRVGEWGFVVTEERSREFIWYIYTLNVNILRTKGVDIMLGKLYCVAKNKWSHGGSGSCDGVCVTRGLLRLNICLYDMIFQYCYVLCRTTDG